MGGSLAEGEWFEVYDANSKYNTGGVKQGSLSFPFDSDTAYDGTSAHYCKAEDPTKLGCAGPCGDFTPRAILCCFAACKP